MSKYTTFAHLTQLAERAQGYSADIAALALAAAADEFETVSLPVSAWGANTDTAIYDEGYLYMAEANVTGITSADGADAEVAINSRATAKVCGLAHISQTIAGAVRFYAKTVPSSVITLQLHIMRADA